MTYYLGFDGGGTKTECVVLDASGHVLAEAVAGPSNPLRAGFDRAFDALRTAAATALGQAKLESRQVRGVCAGLAGAGRPRVAQAVLSFLKEAFPHSFVQVATDFEVALEAAAGSGPGVVLIAGTGSAAFGRNAAGQLARAGGHGPSVGDEGSAFDIGRRAVAAAARARDFTGPATRLVEVIPAALGCPTWDELTERIARSPDDVFPLIFPLVVEAAEARDTAAREMLFTAAVDLAGIARAVIRRLNLEGEEFVLAKSGGVFGRSRLLDATLDSMLRSAAPRAQIRLLETPPAVGAARLARRLAGLSAGPSAAGTARNDAQG
jgi:N-acetylglucosamine kinase-like BadF-type ATPase